LHNFVHFKLIHNENCLSVEKKVLCGFSVSVSGAILFEIFPHDHKSLLLVSHESSNTQKIAPETQPNVKFMFSESFRKRKGEVKHTLVVVVVKQMHPRTAKTTKTRACVFIHLRKNLFSLKFFNRKRQKNCKEKNHCRMLHN
jgi:hypothetical protein